MADNIHLKAFVRLDGQNRVVAGSLIMRKNKPRVGHWMEIVTGQCCVPPVADPFGFPNDEEPLTTTTSTTIVPGTTTTTTTLVPTTTTTTTIP